MTRNDTTAQGVKLEALRHAATVLEERLVKDSFPDLYDLCKSKYHASPRAGAHMHGPPPHADPTPARPAPPRRATGSQDVIQRGSISTDAENGPNFNSLRKDAFLSLPDYIFQQYDTVQSRSFMGIFPEINRVWISIDNRLYLWNYEDNSDSSINTFDDQEQIIISAALVKPVPGVFLEQIEYVLVVATPLEIILLGVAFTKREKQGLPRGAMTIYRTDMSISSDGVNMTSIKGTDTGRIFMRGNNGQLYELEYEAQDGWFVRKIRKINRTSSSIAAFVPTFLLWGSENAVKSFTIDNKLKALYTVAPNNAISVYSLGPDGKDMICIAKIPDLFSQVIRFSNSIPQSALDERTFEVVSLHPVSRVESTTIHLLGVTSTGIRLYFSTSQPRDRFSFGGEVSAASGPSTLRLVYARGPPVLSQGLSHYNAIGSGKIHEAYYADGLLVAAQAFSDEIDRVIGVSLNVGLMTQAPTMFLSETFSYTDVDGKTWAVAEAPSRFVAQSSNTSAGRPGAFLNELAMQFEFPARRFFLLTNMGLSTVSKLRPADMLMQLLKQAPGQDLRFFEHFFAFYGPDQSCAMALGIACGHSSFKTTPADIFLPAVTSLATRLFFELGGKPTLVQGQPLQPAAGPLGIPVSTFEVRFSAKHNGFAIYFARTLRPIWKKEIIKRITKSNGGEAWELVQTNDELMSVQMNLQSLARFLAHYVRFAALPSPDTRPPGVDPEAWKTEQESLANMHHLVHQAIETISFVSLLIDCKLPLIVAAMSDAEKRELHGFTFDALVSTAKGRDVGKMLMASLVNKQLEKGLSVQAITSMLQDRCPTICQDNDVVFYKGMEMIQSAKTMANRDEQLGLLNESLRQFLSVTKHIHFEKLRTIIENYKSLQFFAGVVDLALKYASDQDSKDSSELGVGASAAAAAAAAAAGSAGSAAAAAASQSHFRRIECYQLIFSMFANMDSLLVQGPANRPPMSVEEVDTIRSQVLARALASQDQAFHTSLYDWFIQQGMHDQVLQIQSPYIEDYFKARSHSTMSVGGGMGGFGHDGNGGIGGGIGGIGGSGGDFGLRDFYWQYLIRNSQFVKAARALMEIAQSPDLDLPRRIEYLTKAVTSAKSTGVTEYNGQQDLLDLITDELDVACLQLEIYKRLEMMPDTENLLHELNYSLLDVNTLFHHFAKPYQMYDVILQILHIADHGVQSRPVAEAAWTAMIEKTKEEALRNNRSPFDALSDKVKDLGRRFHPDDNVFSLRFLVNKLEQESYEYGDRAFALESGWVVDALRGADVPFTMIFQTFHELFETKLPPWSSNAALVFLIKDIEALLTKWLEHVRSLTGSAYEKEDFPARTVDEAISKYLVTIREDETQLVAALHQIQTRLRRTF
ncbi:hypothetical protein HK105_203325 [Polyrhizophydium stewartii]|uniref:Nucleoporin n=1 Tax=Polyrhizophydium stewartii TaxID=2732419 RepID=A0ABR4NCJ0_9FUNG